jgi:predicted nucleic acid-binding protein
VYALVDTGILVYRFDPAHPAKQRRAVDLLREGVASGRLVVPYQAVVEFVAATTRRRRSGPALLTGPEAASAAEGILACFEVIYPDPAVLRLALMGAAHHGLPWFDAQVWACAEAHGIPTLLSEDFAHGRLYGTVRAVDPFRAA